MICPECSNPSFPVFHGDEPCTGVARTIPLTMSRRIVVHPNVMDARLRRLYYKLSRNATIGVVIEGTPDGDRWGAFVYGVPRTIEVSGFKDEAAAWSALKDEMMLRAVTRGCGGSDG